MIFDSIYGWKNLGGNPKASLSVSFKNDDYSKLNESVVSVQKQLPVIPISEANRCNKSNELQKQTTALQKAAGSTLHFMNRNNQSQVLK